MAPGSKGWRYRLGEDVRQQQGKEPKQYPLISSVHEIDMTGSAIPLMIRIHIEKMLLSHCWINIYSHNGFFLHYML